MQLSTELRALSARPIIHWLALIILFTASTRFEPFSSTVLDPDLWWHLRGGDSIVHQHSVPLHAVFTQHAERPWVEYSWGFEVIASRFYKWWGLMGLVALRFSLEVTITALLFMILRQGLSSFWLAWVLTIVGMWSIHHCLGLQPMLASIVLFAFELGFIFRARRQARVRPLLWLPFLFLLWANLHIQFVYGIMVLLLFAASSVAQAIVPARWMRGLEPGENLPLRPVLGITALSVLATLVGPYSWHLYGVIANYVHSSVPYRLIIELQALNFRVPEHFVFVLVVAAAYWALGWRRSRDPFNLILLTLATLIGFRMTRDSWLASLTALAIIADRRTEVVGEEARNRFRQLSWAASLGVGIAVMFCLIAWDAGVNNRSLERVVAANFPAAACQFVRAHSLPGSIYNDMNWGGFLIWALPEKPVAIDNRTDLYGDEIYSRAYLVQQGFQDWTTDPDLSSAGVILLSRRTPLARLLIQNAQFRLVYRDPLALVLTPDLASKQGPDSQPARP